MIWSRPSESGPGKPTPKRSNPVGQPAFIPAVCSGLTGLCLALLSCSSLAAGVYRWVDEEGLVHYSDVPEGAEVEVLEVESKPTDPNRIAAELEREREQSQQRAIQEREAEEDASEQAKLAKQVSDERAENCRIAQERMERYSNARRLYRPLPGGGREYLTDDELSDARNQAIIDVNQWCK